MVASSVLALSDCGLKARNSSWDTQISNLLSLVENVENVACTHERQEDRIWVLLRLIGTNHHVNIL